MVRVRGCPIYQSRGEAEVQKQIWPWMLLVFVSLFCWVNFSNRDVKPKHAHAYTSAYQFPAEPKRLQPIKIKRVVVHKTVFKPRHTAKLRAQKLSKHVAQTTKKTNRHTAHVTTRVAKRTPASGQKKTRISRKETTSATG
jgi:hypothetical protein